MRIVDDSLIVSPSDLSSFLGCRHRIALDLADARGVLDRPILNDPYAAILAQHGVEHEQQYVASLQAAGLNCANAKPADRTPGAESLRLTLDAMRAGADVIVQARLEAGNLAGYADVIRKVPIKSDLGDWSYEAHDTKLTRETKGATILQLSAYSQMLAEMQGRIPDAFCVVTPVATERYLVADYAAYYRLVRCTLDRELAKGHEQLIAEYYPEPVDACQMCAWEKRCEQRRRQDDHLSYIAGLTRTNRLEFVTRGITRLAAAAQMPVPAPFKPSRGARETYDRLGHQARVQHQQRTEHRPIVERLPIQEGEGLCRLPTPSRGDVFLDLEGARFAREGGREYLIGLWSSGVYRAWWAFDDQQEKAAFEEVMDAIMRAWEDDPSMHVYHFNHYEPTAFKKLMGRHVTRGEQLDRLLRAERFVDLYPIARQAVRAGVESYSIKKLEQYSGYQRKVALQGVRDPKLQVEQAIETGAIASLPAAFRDVVQGYNEDDCRSTEALRDWLETLRQQWESDGTRVPRPAEQVAEPDRPKAEVQLQAEAIRARLLDELPADASAPSHPDHHRWLLAYLVDWHRREVNASWWEFFRLMRLAEEDLLEERDALVGVTHVERVGYVMGTKGKPTKSVVDRYSYPEQEQELGSSGDLHTHDKKAFGKSVAHNRMARTIDVEKGPSRADLHPNVLIKSTVVNVDELQKSIVRFAERFLAPNSSDECGAQLLRHRQPRLLEEPFAVRLGETEQQFAIRVVTKLDRTTLAIQGPPGAGKTYIGAQMILALARAGKKVGVTATSHRVIHNLLADVLKYATPEDGAQVAAKGDEDDGAGVVRMIKGNDAPLQELQAGTVNVLGGTSWLWARESYAGAVDVLFVDEAGQLSLANVLAVSQAANSLVLLGDPQQLDQPEKASHPDGVGVSALEHVLGGHETMPAGQGIFLPITWRMSPTLTAFTSELFYEGKLTAKEGLERQALAGVQAIAGSKLWLVPVDHDGNQSASDEEAIAVAALVEQLLAPGSTWIDENGKPQQMTADAIRVVAPFNAQVNRLAERIAPHGVQVGTVDKFQGQTCAVVIYSMATSRPEDAPRGLEFLYSLNRLNVATSRARCAVFIVASPRLFEPECRTPRQMQLANALCRYVEMAQVYDGHQGRPSS